jgi:type II secretory ATPase GspE/PulE/Tfp pilus assembly ATPase PilB-like protein
MIVNKEIQELISAGADTSKITEAAVRNGLRTLWERGLEKVRGGETSLEELIRVTRPS